MQAAMKIATRAGVPHKAARGFSTSATFDLPVDFKGHLCEPPPQQAEATKEELLEYHKNMFLIRRMEIAADGEYKARNIRGFCHLYDGQEAIAQGIEAAFTREDDVITTYRCHGMALVRGSSVQAIFEELLGFRNGVSRGKGGSMHMYNKSSNFYGGAAIVGAQVPIGAGLGFSHKYRRENESDKMNVSIAMYGDGSANQGQVWEAANMAALWKLPVIFACENNEYGMGTSVNRSSYITEYYKQGNTIPGIFIDGMDVLAVREGMKFVKDYCGSGNGPMYVELKTYRYHGHSMSDPGISYRTRDEVTNVRQSRDPIELVKKRLVEAGFSTEDELKEIEKALRKEVQDALKAAKESSVPDDSELATDIYTTGKKMGDGPRLESEMPSVVRMPDITNNLHY
ncbi:Pyruvate dehydrogenase E1 component subunit alpha, mitochondrial [Hondaea fermentalgiana]|uniref:Pyruvate dehydrogenase E1 component subunit alpha n=1 Tax=Hondaea fermentalgiana TaxID=2315210 RepID=A0A2R5G849_9STRA|nr:Pyruvate dehydrogenase E1 component subunit alpha, mitochondrial [Hondaea fermentalgiana]|eukprot:GBG25968.1 Pyruvate dehydrogenase E1 component subunit alpha, mitochondrial [Hondaea fermentalgiana]